MTLDEIHDSHVYGKDEVSLALSTTNILFLVYLIHTNIKVLKQHIVV